MGGVSAQEMNHDELYLADLRRTRRHRRDGQGDAAPPTTVRLLATLEARIAEWGSLPAVAYSVFVEWNSKQASPAVAERVEAAFGPACVKGAEAPISPSTSANSMTT